MRPSELQYCRNQSLFYADPDNLSAESAKIDNVSFWTYADNDISWKSISEGPWQHHCHQSPMAEQGWKIHISSIPEEAQTVLSIASRIFLDNATSFKHLRNQECLRRSLAKYGDRIQCGKFIVGYPQEESVAVRLLKKLSDELKSFHGPVVLGDAQWGSAPIYFRYGAFRRIVMEDPESGLVAALRAPNGNLEEDRRSVHFSCPSWVSIPEEMVPHISRRFAPNTSDNDWYPYEIESVIHFSNSGGVYRANCCDSGESVVLKEARPYVGLDDFNCWAVDRLNHEAEAMKLLAGVPAIVRFKEFRKIGGHSFLIEEHVDGTNLNSWIAQNYPFALSESPLKYVNSAIQISKKLKKTLQAVHERGYALVDFQPMNIIIDPELEPRIIDLETVRPLSDSSPVPIGTPGFVAKEGTDPESNDWFAYNRVVAQLFYPLVPLNSLSDSLIEVQMKMARQTLGCHIPFDTLLMPESPEARRSDTVPYLMESRQTNLDQLESQLIEGIHASAYVFEGVIRIPGDIVSFSGIGHYNIESGLAGAAYTDAIKTALNSEDAIPKIEDDEIMPRGYLSGIDGILLERGEDIELLKLQEDRPDGPIDVSLRSGLAGIALAKMASLMTQPDTKVDNDLTDLIAQLQGITEDPSSTIVSFETSSRKAAGLIDGWSGVGLALDRASLLLGDDSLHMTAVNAFRRDLDLTTRARDGSLQVLDNGRLMPYLAEGSAGILFALLMASERLRSHFSSRTLNRLAKAADVRCTANGGLFMGRTGLLLVRHFASLTGIDCVPVDTEILVNEITPYCFKSKSGKGVIIGGQGGLRLSTDYCSGNAGVVRAIDTFKDSTNPWLLFPGLSSLQQLEHN